MKENDAFFFIGNIPSFKHLLNEVLELTLEDWVEYTKRKIAGGAAAENTDTIPLMYDLEHRINSNILHKNYERFSVYIDAVIFSTRQQIGETNIKQAMLTRLRAGTVIPRHRDMGPLTAKTHRIHIPVTTNEQCIFTIDDESKNLKPGEIWIVDNVGRSHGVENNGNIDRVHLIIDAQH